MMSGTNAELIAQAREAAGEARDFAENSNEWERGDLFDELADALEASALTSAEDQIYIRRIEVERDAALAIVAELAARLPGVLDTAESTLHSVNDEWSTDEWPGDDEDYAAIIAVRAVLTEAAK